MKCDVIKLYFRLIDFMKNEQEEDHFVHPIRESKNPYADKAKCDVLWNDWRLREKFNQLGVNKKNQSISI